MIDASIIRSYQATSLVISKVCSDSKRTGV